MNPNQRQNQRNPPQNQNNQQQNEAGWGQVAAAVAAGVAAAAATYYVGNQLFNSTQQQSERNEQPQALSESGSYHWLDPRSLFWKKVEQQQNEEEECVESVLVPEAKYAHPYNKFDIWFQNLLAQKLKISIIEKKMYREAFEELLVLNLLPEMKRADPLFNVLYRDIRPAGSSWEDLRICTPDEYDINVILFPPNVDDGVMVVNHNRGHIGLRVKPGGFTVKPTLVVKKLGSTSSGADQQSIERKLNSWLDGNNYISREKVLKWMISVVDSALNNQLKNKKWIHLEKVTRSRHGPAVTLTAFMKDGKELSIDLVPSLEFSLSYLPRNMQNRVWKTSPSQDTPRTWYAIPKGSKTGSEEEWRTSLYEIERDLMNGNYHLKPCIRITKRLRDNQKNWKGLSSYYIKTMFMWMMEDNISGWGLGRIMMHALKKLENSLRENSIQYYWDDDLNLLDNVDNPKFFRDVADHINNKIIKAFERSLVEDSVDPMLYFGSSRYAHHIQSESAGISFHPNTAERESRENENCLIM